MTKKNSEATTNDGRTEASPRFRPVDGSGSCALDIISALAKEIPVRDIRAVAVLLILARDDRRSTPNRLGASIEYLSSEIGENTEAVRHIVRNLEIAGLAMCCGRLSRTRLYTATQFARKALGSCGIAADSLILTTTNASAEN